MVKKINLVTLSLSRVTRRVKVSVLLSDCKFDDGSYSSHAFYSRNNAHTLVQDIRPVSLFVQSAKEGLFS